MSLQTHEEEALARRIKRIEEKLDALFLICAEILCDVAPETYPATDRILVAPTK